MIYRGGCHCGAVRYELHARAEPEIVECNCSICAKSGYLHLIVPKEDFRLLSGQEQLQTYRFNTGKARHLFCKTCGIKSFYVPRSHPDGIDVNVHCLDTEPASVTVTEFDGRNWEANAHKVAHKSREP